MKKTKYLIIGAGLSGLTLASQLKDDYLILEKDSRVGGLCKSFKQGDFVFDCGGHFFHGFNDNNLNSGIIKVKKNTKIAFDNGYINYPFQNYIHELNEKQYNRCLADFEKREKYASTDLLNHLYSLYGKTSVNLFLKPYNQKLYCTSLKNLDKDCFGRFFPSNNKNTSYNDEFLYDKYGCEHYYKNVFESVDKNKILFNTSYTKIDVNNKIVYTNNEPIKYEYLINTSPFNNFLKAVNNKEFLKYKKHLKYNKVLILNIGFNKNSNTPYHWIYVPHSNINFYRVGFYSNITNLNKLSVYLEIGFNPNAKINVNKELNNAISGLKQLNIIDDSFKIEEHNFVICDPAYVHINKVSNNLVNNFKNEMEKLNVYTLGRYGNWEYSSMIDNIKDANAVFKKLKGE